MIKNYMESLVADLMRGELNNTNKYANFCTCPACVAFAQAAALNELPCFYVTSVAGEVYGEYQSKEMDNLAEVLVAVGKGLNKLTQQDPYGHIQKLSWENIDVQWFNPEEQK